MIRVNSLMFTYPGQSHPTLRGLTFSIGKGEIFGFLGPSGSGKSTTQKLLIGLLEGYEGEISILEKDARTWGTDLYERVGVGFELPNHFSNLTGLENLQFFSSLYGKSVRSPVELLTMVGLGDATHLRTKHYSKGMKMRLNFVRAIQHDPEIIFLDEPTAGLDPVNARHLKDIILDLKESGKTIFLTTHNMHDADELCDQVAFIYEGELKSIGPPRELKMMHGDKKVDIEYLSEQTVKREEFGLENLHDNEAFMAILQGNQIETMHSREATLEDVFLHVTGGALR